VAPDEPVLVELYWHHWEVEPPLAQEISQWVVEQARRQLVPSAVAQTDLAKAA
jgi:LysR family transcriptional regulator (chromosome initiation inhibitor)